MISESNCITEEEAELYDRQIRLWGANVQRSLRNTKVLVIGMKGVAAEVCKNLILSGVKSVTMMDDENVTEEDLYSQYFLCPDDVDKNRAEASIKAAKILNPNVKVTSDPSSPLDKPISYYSNFDVVCVTKQSSTVNVCLNSICKLYNVKFFCGDSFGMFGYIFEDLNEHRYNSKNTNKRIVSFDAALNFNWTPKTSLKKRKYEDPSYLVFKILIDFRDSYNRDPSRNFEETDKKMLLSLRDSVLEKYNAEHDILPVEYLENVYGEYGPTCSIIGGMISQEIIKSLSKDDSSSYNIYFFNHLRCQMTGTSLCHEVNSAMQKNNFEVIGDDIVVEL